MLLSVVATVLSLVPPYITKIMVDDVIPNKDAQKLIVVLVWLMGVYVFQYIVNGIRSYKLRITGNKITLNLKKDIFEKTKEFAPFIDEFDTLWDEAEEYANSQQLDRIRKSRVHWDYINLYNTWDRRMENASIAERKELTEKNKTLYERIQQYGILQRYDNDATIRAVADFSLSPALWWS